MAEFVLSRESIEEQYAGPPVLISESEDGVEQRRQRNQKEVIGFSVKSSFLTKSNYSAYRTWFKNQYGALTTFQFKSPFDDVTYNVRYDDKAGLKSVFADGVYKCEFSFKVV